MFWTIFAAAIVTVVTSQDVDVVTTDDVTHEAGVQEIILPMCRNFLPYTHTKLPNKFGHTTQREVYRNVQNMWAFMDYGCSPNFRRFVCAVHLPRWDPAMQTTHGPCKETCSKARSKCKKTMKQLRSRWPRNYKCSNLTSKRTDPHCLKPVREPRRALQHSYCTQNTIPLCQNLPYTLGSLPNLFLQRNLSEIQIELSFYQPLIETGCDVNLAYFLCATYVPFCVHDTQPFTIPCKEFCEQVHTGCSSNYSNTYQNLPWPNKLQCHRFPSAESNRGPCIMPGDF